MLNKFITMGRMTREPELRRLQSGVAVATFTLAVDEDFKNQDGGRDTDFIDCQIWRGGAEFAQKYFRKGSMAVVEGRLKVRDWKDKDGAKRRSTYVNVEQLRFGESKRDGSAPANGNVSNLDTSGEFPEMYGEDDQLPFEV